MPCDADDAHAAERSFPRSESHSWATPWGRYGDTGEKPGTVAQGAPRARCWDVLGLQLEQPAVPDRMKGIIHTMGDTFGQQSRALLPRLLVFGHDQLAHGPMAVHVFDQLFAKQRGMVPA
jgi:hypothetical protein